MTVMERLTGADVEPEGTMPTPGSLPAVPGTSAIPWWIGVPGLDPDVRWESWKYKASCAATACAVHVLGLGAGRADWLRGQMKAPVKTWVRWLAEGGEYDAPRRMMVLRLVCERSADIHPDHILSFAKEICDAGALQ